MSGAPVVAVLAVDPADAAGLESLAAFIHAHNRRADGRARCLHADEGPTLEAQRRGLATFLAAGGRLWQVRGGDGEIAAFVGAEPDADAGRCWLRGPLVPDEAGAAALRTLLLEAVRDAMPGLSRFDGFVQTDEAPLIAAYAACGFERRSDYHVMSAKAPLAPASAWPAAVTDATPAHHEAIARLHAASFPTTYLPAPALMAAVDADHRLLVALAEDGELAGYTFVQHKRGENEGYVDYLAVREDRRGSGFGGRLLQAALHWTLVERALPETVLTVEATRATALQLYLSRGFAAVSAGAHLVWQRPG